jgi:hypothetical protein
VAQYLEEVMPDAFSDLGMDSVVQWTPDEGNHLTDSGLIGMSYQEAKTAFAMSPLLVACWTCLANHLSDKDLNFLLTRTDQRLMQIYRDYEHDVCNQALQTRDPLFPPGPRVLLEFYEQRWGRD